MVLIGLTKRHYEATGSDLFGPTNHHRSKYLFASKTMTENKTKIASKPSKNICPVNVTMPCSHTGSRDGEGRSGRKQPCAPPTQPSIPPGSSRHLPAQSKPQAMTWKPRSLEEDLFAGLSDRMCESECWTLCLMPLWRLQVELCQLTQVVQRAQEMEALLISQRLAAGPGVIPRPPGSII